MIRSLLAAVLTLVLPLTVGGQPPPTAVTEPQFEARFLDGSVVVVTVSEATVAITTRYGKLTVPLAEVKKIELGFRYPDGMEAKVKAAVEDLGASDYSLREDAQKRLISYGEYAVPAVRAAAADGSPEAAERCRQILKKLGDKVSSEKLDPRETDVVVTDELTIRGKIETAAFKAKNKYFGEATVKLIDLKEFRPLGAKSGGAFTLDAAKYAKQGWVGWYDTGLEVSKDQPLEISVTGQIDQWPQEPNRYLAGPNGTGAQVPGPGGGGTGMPPGGMPGRAGGPGVGMGAAYHSGAVYGRIGTGGSMFKVGADYKQAGAPATGKLYLIIAPSNWGNECSGEYKVTVKSGG